ncbi:hypothetical protein BN1058_02766 [Paraliobacillus sp. PM-2]|uniref:DUF4367 domain-containing protein n=1 Tax=Paraliobacillus sp. PM-2 TaxID=1462524 RepID=UPI00061C7A3A|nr:DUF4367 domain-containing protein [Paraliobacillus sp. PM-2]CQR48398.1 hypothetical protein BN1058_02766 [Paraliobacillus sp. PM-2]
MNDERKQKYIDDQLLQQVVKKEYNEAPNAAPMKEFMWKQIQMEINEQPKRKSFILYHKKVLSVASVFLILLVGSLFTQLKDGEAFGWFSNYFVEKQADRTEINNQISDEPIEQPPSPPPYDESLKSEELHPIDTDMSLKEAVQEASFHIVTPSKIPKGYRLDYVTRRTYEGAPLEHIFLNYEGKGNAFVIKQSKIIGEFYSSNMTVNNQLAQVETVNLNGVEATLISYDDGTTTLLWVRMRTEITITGELEKDDIIKMAKSLH